MTTATTQPCERCGTPTEPPPFGKTFCPPCFGILYDEACASATTEQGLDEVVGYLRERGVVVEVDQTGGFCMVARVDLAGGANVGIINDRSDEANAFLLVKYCADYAAEGECDHEPMCGETSIASDLKECAEVADVLRREGVAVS